MYVMLFNRLFAMISLIYLFNVWANNGSFYYMPDLTDLSTDWYTYVKRFGRESVHRQTDRRTDGQTDRWTDGVFES